MVPVRGRHGRLRRASSAEIASACSGRSWAGIADTPVPCASAPPASPGRSSWPRSWPSRPRCCGSRRPGLPSWTASLARAARRGGAIRRPARLVWPGLQPTGTEPPACRARHRGPSRRPRARRRRRAGVAARGGSLHRASRGGHGLRTAGRRRGHQRPARAGAARRPRPHAPRAPGPGGRARRATGPRDLDARSHGARRHRLSTEAARLRLVPRRWLVRQHRQARRPARPRRGPRASLRAARSRWLRGRIVARLRDLEGAAWTRLPEAIGGHGPDGIASAIAALRRDGLLEVRADGAVRLPAHPP